MRGHLARYERCAWQGVTRWWASGWNLPWRHGALRCRRAGVRADREPSRRPARWLPGRIPVRAASGSGGRGRLPPRSGGADGPAPGHPVDDDAAAAAAGGVPVRVSAPSMPPSTPPIPPGSGRPARPAARRRRRTAGPARGPRARPARNSWIRWVPRRSDPEPIGQAPRPAGRRDRDRADQPGRLFPVPTAAVRGGRQRAGSGPGGRAATRYLPRCPAGGRHRGGDRSPRPAGQRGRPRRRSQHGALRPPAAHRGQRQ